MTTILLISITITITITITIIPITISIATTTEKKAAKTLIVSSQRTLRNPFMILWN
jgi:hypothetical protein